MTDRLARLARSLGAAPHLFLTGGSGFVGQTVLDLCARLRSEANLGIRVTVLTRAPGEFLERCPRYRGQQWIELSAGSLDAFPAPDRRYSHVLHAAIDTTLVADRIALVHHLVDGTERALEFARRSAARGFLFTSSGAVYRGVVDASAPIAEDSPLGLDPIDATSAYGQAKRLAEHLCALYAADRGVPARIARCFAFADERLPPDGPFAYCDFIRQGLADAAIEVAGDGRAVRTYMHGDDLAFWLMTILARGRDAHPYNVGSDQAISIADLATMIGARMAPPKPVVIRGRMTDLAGRSWYVPDIGRARAELGLALTVGLDEAIDRTIAARGARAGY